MKLAFSSFFQKNPPPPTLPVGRHVPVFDGSFLGFALLSTPHLLAQPPLSPKNTQRHLLLGLGARGSELTFNFGLLSSALRGFFFPFLPQK